jgi:hypothetical protein
MSLRLKQSEASPHLGVSAAVLLFCLGIVSVAMAQTHKHSDTRALERTRARETFERLKKLEGKWKGRSTKGWEEVIAYRTIAQGSVVVENSFDAHPNETMMTMFHMDGDRLMLTHYCAARNQPRLVATDFADEGRTITFTFLDAGNLPSRNKGHMDKMVLRFLDDDHTTSKWTWYQDGKEKWLEEIRSERIK